MKTVTLKLMQEMTQEEAEDFFCEAHNVFIKDGRITFEAEECMIDFLVDMAVCEGIAA
jgi:hypothetical protein